MHEPGKSGSEHPRQSKRKPNIIDLTDLSD